MIELDDGCWEYLLCHGRHLTQDLLPQTSVFAMSVSLSCKHVISLLAVVLLLGLDVNSFAPLSPKKTHVVGQSSLFMAKPQRLDENVDGVLYVNDRVSWNSVSCLVCYYVEFRF